MPLLTINQLVVPVYGWNSDDAEVADVERSFSGKTLKTVSSLPWEVFSGQHRSSDVEAVRALRWLMKGRGYGWSWYASFYADWKGLGPVASDDVSRYSSGGKYAGRAVVSEDAFLEYPVPMDIARPWSLSVWEKVSGAWHHWVETGGAWYYDGSPASAPAWFAAESLTSDVVGIILSGEGAVREFSDLLVYPFTLPLAWIATIANYGAAFPKPPKLAVAGDLVPDGQTYVCEGKQISKVTASPAGAGRIEAFDFTLESDPP